MKTVLAICVCMITMTLPAQRLAAKRTRVAVTCTATPATVTAGAIVTLKIVAGAIPTAIPKGEIVHYEWFGSNIFFPGNGSIGKVNTTSMSGLFVAYGEVMVMKNNVQYADERCRVTYEVRP